MYKLNNSCPENSCSYGSGNFPLFDCPKTKYTCNYRAPTIPPLNQIYTYKNAEFYSAKPYTRLTDMIGGSIYYNVNQRPIEQVFSAPIFMNTSKIEAKMYTDPMGSVKPEYNRIQKENNNGGQLTWIQDSNEWREDLISRQQRKFNQTVYDPKWNIY
jgi:hypothetical protein